MLDVLTELPPGLLELEAPCLYECLAGPTLLHLGGESVPPLFVSVLLHGNETTGWDAVRTLLGRARRADRALARPLSLLIGNVAAARAGLRRLDDQADYNRVWRGAGTPEHAMAAAVQAELRRRRPIACIDVHNNTGRNPRFPVINRLEAPWLRLAARFARQMVYTVTPDTTASVALSALAPSITIECGQPGSPDSLDHALAYLEGCLTLDPADLHEGEVPEVRVLHTMARVRVPRAVSIAFDDRGADLRLPDHIDNLNFREVPAGSAFGWVRNGAVPVVVTDESGLDVTSRYFEVRDGKLVAREHVIPGMLSLDERAIREDCLCYLMEHIAIPAEAA